MDVECVTGSVPHLFALGEPLLGTKRAKTYRCLYFTLEHVRRHPGIVATGFFVLTHKLPQSAFHKISPFKLLSQAQLFPRFLLRDHPKF